MPKKTTAISFIPSKSDPGWMAEFISKQSKMSDTVRLMISVFYAIFGTDDISSMLNDLRYKGLKPFLYKIKLKLDEMFENETEFGSSKIETEKIEEPQQPTEVVEDATEPEEDIPQGY